MGHLTAVWNITAALGGSPRFGRMNFPLDPGGLPANVVVRLAPFSEAVLQHFIYLERPDCSDEPDGAGFDAGVSASRAAIARAARHADAHRLRHGRRVLRERCPPNLRAFVARVGEKEAFCGDRNLQISRKEIDFQGCDPVICSITALKAFDAIVSQGEGAARRTPDSHYCRFLAIRDELRDSKAANPAFEPAHPAAVNPVLRRPVRAGARVWLENEDSRGHRRPREHRLHADAAADLAFLSAAAAASGEGAVRRSRARADARHDAARRTRRAPARGPVESGLQRRHVVHGAARCRAAAARRRAPASFSSSGCASSRRARSALAANGDARVAQAAEDPHRARAARRARLRGHREGVAGCAERRQRRASRAGAAPAAAATPPPAARRGGHRAGQRGAHAAHRRRRRLHRRPRPHAHLRRQEVHSLALLRDLGAEGVHREREGTVDQSRRHVRPRRSPRSRTCACRAPFATSARTGKPDESAAAGESHLRARRTARTPSAPTSGSMARRPC